MFLQFPLYLAGPGVPIGWVAASSLSFTTTFHSTVGMNERKFHISTCRNDRQNGSATTQSVV